MESVVAFAGVALGAMIQGSIGFGFAFVAVPLMALLAPEAVPATLLLIALPMTILLAVRERGEIDRPGLVQATAGRIPGTFLGLWLLYVVPADSISVVVGIIIGVAVALSALAPDLETRPSTVLTAGFASGAMGTASAVGGAPLALAYQARPGSELRATLSASFVLGTLISLTGLAAVGRLNSSHLWLALELIPGMLVGLAASRALVRVLDRRWLRPAVLAFAAAASVATVAKGLAG